MMDSTLDPQPSLPIPPEWCTSQQDYRAWLDDQAHQREMASHTLRLSEWLSVPPLGDNL